MFLDVRYWMCLLYMTFLLTNKVVNTEVMHILIKFFVYLLGRVGKESFSITCNNCGAVMNTEVHVDTGIVAWAAAGKAFDQSISS